LGLRACAVSPIAARLDALPSALYDDNVARHHARLLLAGAKLGTCR
jgi:hypothetical protein